MSTTVLTAIFLRLLAKFELWEGDNGWKRFKKAVMSAVFGYAKAYAENKGAP
jgi:hypothetical protein